MKNEVIRDTKGNNLDSSSFNNPKYVDINPLPPSIEIVAQIQMVMSTMQKAVMAMQAVMLVTNILLSKSLQDLWGMLNT